MYHDFTHPEGKQTAPLAGVDGRVTTGSADFCLAGREWRCVQSARALAWACSSDAVSPWEPCTARLRAVRPRWRREEGDGKAAQF